MAGQKMDVTRASGVPPDPKVNKAKELTYLTISIVISLIWTLTPVKTNPRLLKYPRGVPKVESFWSHDFHFGMMS